MIYPNKIIGAQDTTAAEIEKDFKASVSRTTKLTDWQQIQTALGAQNHPEEIIKVIKWDNFDDKEALQKLFKLTASIHKEYLGTIAGEIKFDLVDPKALEWIDQYAADEILYISNSQKEAIKAIVRKGYDDGITVQRQAQQIRAHIGLDPTRSETLSRYGEDLLAKGNSEAETWRLMESYGKELLNDRARTIAINEASEASSRATYESTKGAIGRGIIDPNLYEEFRIITADERICNRCVSVEGEARKLPDGSYPSTGSQIAKVHVKCRCVAGLREMSKQSIKVIEKRQIKGFSDIVFDTQALKRKDGIIYCQTVPIIEGVYEQWGIRVYRSYAEFSKYSHWLAGIPVVTNHEEVTPEGRRIGQLFDPVNKPEGLKTAATTHFYEMDLTQREMELILSAQPIEGSLRWMCYIVKQQGTWIDPNTGEQKPYDFAEVGPYVFEEYSMVRAGVIGTKDGAGFNVQCKDCKKNLIHHAPGGADMEKEEIEGLIQEAIKPFEAKIAALEQENATLKGGQTKIVEDLQAKEKAATFEAFKGKLKPGHEAKAQEFFDASQKDPSWMLQNLDKFVQEGTGRQLQGAPIVDGSQTFDLAKEQDKLFGRTVG